MSWVFDGEVLAVLSATMIVAAVFAAAQALYAGRVVEPFSELGLLGPSGKIGDYPRNVVAGSPFQLNIYVGNHEGKTIYYRVLVKVGDKSSIINASMPLSVEPIMDIRVVLGHNSSIIIPINITLYEPMINARLVFEMWIYDENTGTFKYHGRWNQLWINVTEPAVPASPQQHDGALSLRQDIESKVAEAYAAVRRAESAGGNVSEMITLLNAAIGAAYKGNLEETEDSLRMVLSLEQKVTEDGLRLSKLRLYSMVAGVTVVASACIGLYLYLRRNACLLWAKFYKGWKVALCETRSGENSGRNRKAGGILGLINKDGGLTVSDLVIGPKAINPNPRLAARELYRMVRAGVIRIYDPNPPRTFSSFILSRYNAGFMIAVAILALGAACIYLSEPINALAISNPFNPVLPTLSATTTLIRYALGSIIVLFLPGYSLVEALYPDKSELSPLERLALSIGLSLALVPLIGLILNYTPWGIRLNPILISLASLTVMLLLVSAYRKLSLMRKKGFS